MGNKLVVSAADTDFLVADEEIEGVQLVASSEWVLIPDLEGESKKETITLIETDAEKLASGRNSPEGARHPSTDFEVVNDKFETIEIEFPYTEKPPAPLAEGVCNVPIPIFRVYIFDYQWVLEYRKSLTPATSSSSSDKPRPFEVEWIGATQQVKDPGMITEKKNALLDFTKRGVVAYKGWDYTIVDQQESPTKRISVELNVMRDKGIRLTLENEASILLETTYSTDENKNDDDGAPEGDEKVETGPISEPVTHCFVDCVWFLSAPVVKSVTFYCDEKVVHTLKAT